jgi:hypothetical protein
MASDTFNLGWASDNPRAVQRIYELCEGHQFGAELFPDALANQLDPPVERGSMLVRLADDRVYIVAPDGSACPDPARLLGTYTPIDGGAPPPDAA